MNLNEGDGLFYAGIALVVLGTLVITPFIIIFQLSEMRWRVKRIAVDAANASKHLAAIEKNTADVARFFNEKDVKIEG